MARGPADATPLQIRPSRLVTSEDYRRAARRALPRMIFDYVDGGAGVEATVRENADAIARRRLLPRAPVDVSVRSTATRLLGFEASLPLVVGPTGGASVYWRDGDAVLAQAAARRGIPFVMSIGSTMPVERLCERAGAPVWAQLYLIRNRDLLERILQRLEACGVDVLQATVDTAVPGPRHRDRRNGFSLPLRWTPRTIADVAMRPAWALRMLSSGTPVPDLVAEEFRRMGREPGLHAVMRELINPAASWADLAWLRDRWKGRLVVKGLTSPRDAELAAAHGMDGIVVSNHGGRQLDGAIATIDALPEVVDAVGGRLAVLVDGGFRSGTDVVKALALGADAVQLGRATLFALAAGGATAVDTALATIASEIDTAFALLGVCRVADLERSHVR